MSNGSEIAMSEKIKRPSTPEEENPGASRRNRSGSPAGQLRHSVGLRAIGQAAREQMRVQSPLLEIKSKT